MKLSLIQTKAKDIGLNPVKMKKDELIRTIQAKEGNPVCYRIMRSNCDQYSCCWRKDCNPK
jgi:hypothetical protein